MGKNSFCTDEISESHIYFNFLCFAMNDMEMLHSKKKKVNVLTIKHLNW